MKHIARNKKTRPDYDYDSILNPILSLASLH